MPHAVRLAWPARHLHRLQRRLQQHAFAGDSATGVSALSGPTPRRCVAPRMAHTHPHATAAAAQGVSLPLKPLLCRVSPDLTLDDDGSPPQGHLCWMWHTDRHGGEATMRAHACEPSRRCRDTPQPHRPMHASCSGSMHASSPPPASTAGPVVAASASASA